MNVWCHICIILFLGWPFCGLGCSLTDSLAVEKMRAENDSSLAAIADKIEADQELSKDQEAVYRSYYREAYRAREQTMLEYEVAPIEGEGALRTAMLMDLLDSRSGYILEFRLRPDRYKPYDQVLYALLYDFKDVEINGAAFDVKTIEFIKENRVALSRMDELELYANLLEKVGPYETGRIMRLGLASPLIDQTVSTEYLWDLIVGMDNGQSALVYFHEVEGGASAVSHNQVGEAVLVHHNRGVYYLSAYSKFSKSGYFDSFPKKWIEEAPPEGYASGKAYLKEVISRPVSEALEDYQHQLGRFEERLKNAPAASPNIPVFQQKIENIRKTLESLGFSDADAIFPSPDLRFSVFTRKIPR